MRKGLALAAGAVAAVCVATGAGARETAAPPYLIGANYAWFSNAACDLTDHGIVHDGTRRMPLVSAELQAMREAGIQSLRTIVWNMHDATGQRWGVVDSAGGIMRSGYASNLVQYLKLVRAYGFAQLEIAFGPEWVNDPITPGGHWDPSMFDENWHFIQYVRGLAKKYGPAVTHFDLINEGAASDYQANKDELDAYDAQLYANYVDAYGNADVTISSIVDAGDQSRISNLIDSLEATGRPLPTWFEVHVYSNDPLGALQQTDATLTSKGLTQPISIGETYYDDAQTATALETFLGGTSRPVTEASSWPIMRGADCSGVSAPYSARQLYDPPAPELTAAMGSTVSMSVDGRPLVGLEAGTYHLTLNITDPTATFTLVGRLKARGVGTHEWTLNLTPGIYVYLRNGHGSAFRVF